MLEEDAMNSTPATLTIAPATAPQRMHVEARAARHIDLDQLRPHVQVLRRRIEAGQYLYRAGQPFQALFLIRVGSVKTCELAEDGREQVTGFRMSGELLG